ncbi:MAG: type II and III secretion system protein, partial [Actinomycetia bacterium]|nr:type II and III secretion system protein [Actinomycetes bacterium]
SRLVFIEFLVVQYFYDNGFNWGYSLTEGTRQQLSDISFAPGSGQLSFTYNFVDLLDPRFLVNLLALIDDGDARVVSNPHLAVLDREAGEISLTQTIYVPVSDTGASDFGNVLRFEEVEAAVTLKVKPTVKGPNEIELEIQDGSQIQTFTATDGDIATASSAISTTVRVGNNRTLILGGLIDKQSTDQRSGVPGLSRLPLLGPLFRSQSRQIVFAETVIYITPRLETPSIGRLSAELNARALEAGGRLDARQVEKLSTVEPSKKKARKGRRNQGGP